MGVQRTPREGIFAGGATSKKYPKSVALCEEIYCSFVRKGLLYEITMLVCVEETTMIANKAYG